MEVYKRFKDITPPFSHSGSGHSAQAGITSNRHFDVESQMLDLRACLVASDLTQVPCIAARTVTTETLH
jgi:hypothetical protein